MITTKSQQITIKWHIKSHEITILSLHPEIIKPSSHWIRPPLCRTRSLKLGESPAMFPSACHVVFFVVFRWKKVMECQLSARFSIDWGSNLRELEVSWGVCQRVVYTTEASWFLASFPIKLFILIYPSLVHPDLTLALWHTVVRWSATMETSICWVSHICNKWSWCRHHHVKTVAEKTTQRMEPQTLQVSEKPGTPLSFLLRASIFLGDQPIWAPLKTAGRAQTACSRTSSLGDCPGAPWMAMGR